ncbi:MAG TPA: helix-turn-helix transcriptional regulator [Pyrinomonadaceae bacterium]|jgi:AraC family transcriptional regulator
MKELNAGKYFGSDVKNSNIGGIWTSIARYDETLRTRPTSFNEWHFHQNPHFSFILEGGNIERRKTVSAESRPGEVRFYHTGEPHQNVNVLYPSKNFNVEIDADFLSRYDLSESAIDAAVAANFPNIKFTMLRIYKEAVSQSGARELAVHSLILGAVSKKTGDAKKTLQLPRWADKVVQILRDRWNENPSLKELSEASGVHPITISKHFPKYFSCTLGEYVRRVRIEKSLAFIKQSDDSLTDIAYRCGFADQSHFTRVFKDLTGLKPGVFKKI